MERVGPYRLERRIARGGTAEVWSAVAEEGPLAGRTVALKRSLTNAAADQRRRMIREEARIARRLDHPSLVRVLDAGADRDSAWVVMEMLEGIDAARAVGFGRSQPRPMPDGVALQVVAAVAEGLDWAHRLCDDEMEPLDLVHRDVSPPNVLLGWDGDVRLTDFGLVVARDRDDLTTSGVVQGMEAFMAPEQAKGQAVTPAADVYGCGATLHALVTGRPPIPTWSALLRRMRGSALELGDDLEPGVEAIVRECLELEPERRPLVRDLAERCHLTAQKRLGDESGAQRLRAWLGSVHTQSTGRLDDLFDV